MLTDLGELAHRRSSDPHPDPDPVELAAEQPSGLLMMPDVIDPDSPGGVFLRILDIFQRSKDPSSQLG